MITSERPASEGQRKTLSSRTAKNGGGRVPLFPLLSQLEAALQNPHAGDLAPTQRAVSRAVSLLAEVLPHLPKGGDLYRDGDGGLRVEWEHGSRQIRLSIHAVEEREDYLYWQNGTAYRIETPLNAPLLITWLEWLQKQQ